MSEYQPEPFMFSNERWNNEEQCREYTYTDMQLRITAKSLMLQQNDPETLPRKRAEIERTLGHVVFELAYRTQTLQDYIQMHKDAVMLDAA
jgi:hypothetical protein